MVVGLNSISTFSDPPKSDILGLYFDSSGSEYHSTINDTSNYLVKSLSGRLDGNALG